MCARAAAAAAVAAAGAPNGLVVTEKSSTNESPHARHVWPPWTSCRVGRGGGGRRCQFARGAGATHMEGDGNRQGGKMRGAPRQQQMIPKGGPRPTTAKQAQAGRVSVRPSPFTPTRRPGRYCQAGSSGRRQQKAGCQPASPPSPPPQPFPPHPPLRLHVEGTSTPLRRPRRRPPTCVFLSHSMGTVLPTASLLSTTAAMVRQARRGGWQSGARGRGCRQGKHGGDAGGSGGRRPRSRRRPLPLSPTRGVRRWGVARTGALIHPADSGGAASTDHETHQFEWNETLLVISSGLVTGS